MQDPEISIIIPVYNDVEHLPRAFQSLDRQDARLEVIVVDDGSDTPIENALPAGTKYIRLDHNRGTFEARKAGTALASAPYVAYLDADDVLYDGACRLMIDAARQNGADLMRFDMRKYQPNGQEQWRPPLALPQDQDPYPVPDRGAFLSDFLLGDVQSNAWMRSQCAAIFDTHFMARVYDAIGPVNARLYYMEDTLVAVVAMCLAQRPVLSLTPVYRYMQRNTSVTHGTGVDYAFDLLRQVSVVTGLFRTIIPQSDHITLSEDVFADAMDVFCEQSAMMIGLGFLKFPGVRINPPEILHLTADLDPDVRPLAKTALNTAVRARWLWVRTTKLQEDLKARQATIRTLREDLAQVPNKVEQGH